MSTTPVKTRLLNIGWCLAIPVKAIAGFLLVGTLITSLTGGTDPIVATLYLDAFIAVAVGLTRRIKPRWFAYGSVRPQERHRAQFALKVAAAGALAFLAGQAVALWIYAVVGSTGFDQSVHARQESGAELTALLGLVAAPVAEEMLFRGVVYPLLRQRVSIITAAVVSSVSFGILHGNFVQFAATIPLSIILAMLYERTRKVWPCVLLHLGFNLVATLTPAEFVASLANPVSALMLAAAFAGVAIMLYSHITDQHRDPGADDDEPDADSGPAETQSAT